MNKTKNQLKHFISKKGFLISFGILFLFTGCSQADNSSIQPGEKPFNIEKKQEGKADLKTRLENSIKGLDKDKDLAQKVKSMDGILISLALYKFYASLINEGKASKNNNEQILAKELERKASSSQTKTFPKLRHIYYELIKEKLWVNDIEVKILGSNNKTLQFTAGYFASNKNIQETQTTLYEMFLNLRFKQTQYKWYSGDDEYTYYTISSPKDSEIIE